MTLDEAIRHTEENENNCKTVKFDNIATRSWERCAEKHRQLADWLKELKVYKSIFEDDHPDYEQISYGYVRRKIYEEVYRHG